MGSTSVILDASHNIRELTSRYDEQIEEIDAYVDVKSFASVSANRLLHGGGRSSIDPALRAANSGLVKAIVRRVQTYSDDKGILFFTYKLRPSERRNRRTKSHAQIIETALRNAGIDTDAILPNGKPRFVWLTWGQELGLSNFSYCEHVMATGIYRKSEAVLANMLIGQRDNLLAPEAGDMKVLARIQLSEVFHVLYQAMGRGHCRNTDEGKAGAMQLDYIALDEFPAEFWRTVTPNITLGDWQDQNVSKKAKAKRAAKAMRDYLQSLPHSVDYVSSRALKPAAGLRELPKRTFANARRLLEANLKGWKYQKSRQGYVRFPF